jgi:hypothetical protein
MHLTAYKSPHHGITADVYRDAVDVCVDDKELNGAISPTTITANAKSGKDALPGAAQHVITQVEELLTLCRRHAAKMPLTQDSRL